VTSFLNTKYDDVAVEVVP